MIGQVARRWWPVLALLLLLLVLQGRFWFGDKGWREAQALQDTVSEQRAENARLQQRNDALGAEVEDLKSGETAVEERARSELGMVKPGETFYRVVEPHTFSGAPPAGTPPASAPPANVPPANVPPAEAAPTAPRTDAMRTLDTAPVPAPPAPDPGVPDASGADDPAAAAATQDTTP